MLLQRNQGLRSSTRVGAIRLFFGSAPSFSPWLLASRLTPNAALPDVPGVSGGVVMGIPVTLAEFVAAMLGTLPTMREGLVLTGCADDWVATDEVELDLAGDEGRALAKPAARGGDGAVNELAEFR